METIQFLENDLIQNIEENEDAKVETTQIQRNIKVAVGESLETTERGTRVNIVETTKEVTVIAVFILGMPRMEDIRGILRDLMKVVLIL